MIVPTGIEVTVSSGTNLFAPGSFTRTVPVTGAAMSVLPATGTRPWAARSWAAAPESSDSCVIAERLAAERDEPPQQRGRGAQRRGRLLLGDHHVGRRAPRPNPAERPARPAR